MGALSSEELAAIDRDMRQYGLATGRSFGQEILQEQILDVIAGSSLGIQAAAADVDSLALGGGAFAYNASGSAGLNFAYGAGRLHNGYSVVSVSAGSIVLAPSATNYVEVDRAGTVSANNTAFTAGRMPLYTVVTGASTISTVTNSKALLTLIGPNGVNGAMESTASQTKELALQLGTIATGAGATKFTVRVPTTIGAGTVTKASFVTKDALASDNTNYVDFGVVNKGAAGGGSTALVDRTSAANSTKTTGGAALAAYTPRDLVIASAAVNGGDVLEITVTVTGTLANTLTESSFLLEFGHTN